MSQLSPPPKRARTAAYSGIPGSTKPAFERIMESIAGRPQSSHEAFRVGLDFGTTMTTTAYANLDQPNEVYTVDRFPEDPMPGQLGRQVPSAAAYPLEKFLKVRSDIAGTAIYNDSICPGYKHGYEVQNFLGTTFLDQESTSMVRIERPKSLLDNSSATANTRHKLEEEVTRLGKSKEAVITDYLTVVFLHTKQEMEVRGHGYTSQSDVEVVFAVPVLWQPQANAVMAQCVSDAMRAAKFGIPKDGSAPKLFMVNEAEAAATSALRGGRFDLSRGETFVILDCGGGTVDAGTFTIANEVPLRLETQVLNTQGESCGANMLNEAFFDQIWADLRREKYLQRHGESLKSIIDSEAMVEFENRAKRSFSFTLPRPFPFPVSGMTKPRINQSSRLGHRKYTLTHDEMKAIFLPCLEKIARIMSGQIMGAVKKKVKVDKVVVVGGFSDSSALRHYLQQVIHELNTKMELQVALIFGRQSKCATGVAVGAVFRGNEKEYGPTRVPVLSYGVLRTVPYQPGAIKRYPELEPIRRGKRTKLADGRLWVEDTIYWLIKKGEGPLARVFTSSFISEYHMVMDKEEDWQRSEVIYSSETATQSFLHVKAEENKDAKEVGMIKLDLRPLKNKAVEKNGVYELAVLVKLEVIDRNLSFTVVWPAQEDGMLVSGGCGSFSMLAGFQPGTE